MKTNTPETDAETLDVVIKRGDCHLSVDYYPCGNGDYVPSGFARKLEQERNEARKRVADLESNNRYQRGYAAGEVSARDETQAKLNEYVEKTEHIRAERDQLQKEIERLRGEVEKAWREGFKDGQFGFVPSIVTEVRRDYVWQESHAKRVAEGKE